MNHIYLLNLPEDYLTQCPIETFLELQIGLKKEWLSLKTAYKISHKIISINPSDLEIELLNLGQSSDLNFLDIVKKLSKLCSQNREEAFKKWSYILLNGINTYYKNDTHFFDLISCVYAELEYPDYMSSFIPYMPFNSERSDIESYLYDKNYLIKNLEKYLNEQSIYLKS